MKFDSALRRLQETELEILKAFASFCDEHDLEWFIDSGTVLGALRHGGFIPWDDDSDDVNAFIMKFKIFFMGRFLTHGGVYPLYNVTIFRNGFGRYEDRAMGEHIVVNSGSTAMLSNDCLHYDFKSLDAWIDKHNKYATREVDDYYAVRSANSELANLYGEAEKAKTLRDGLYYRLPKFFRAHLYFFYRYYVKLGFLDGKPGKIYAFLQAYWYRYLVDAKLYEREIMGNDGVK